MYATRFLRRLVSGFLAAGTLLSVLLPASGADLESVPTETLPPETVVSETLASTEPTVTESTEEAPVPVLADVEPAYAFSSEYNLYFGLLHAHTELSDGIGSVEEAFSQAAALEGLDFFAVTDHSNSFDHAASGSITRDGSSLSAEWAVGKAAAAAVTDEDFLGIFGYEMTWPEIRQLGHITTYNTPGWISRDQEGFADDADALEHYLEALAEVPDSVSQFCHPGSLYGDFDRFGHYRPEYDNAVQLLETLGEGSIASYIRALDQYWHPAPTASQNDHNGSWGTKNDLRTVILAEELTEKSLFDAIRARRVYATEDKDLHLTYELDGHSMGSILSRADSPEIFLSVYDPTDPGGFTAEIIAEGGVTLETLEAEGNTDLTLSVPGGCRWYFLKLTQADGDVAVTAPVWVEGFENMGIAGLTADRQIPIQGQELTLTLELFNDEAVDFTLTSLELFAEDTLVCRTDAPGTVAPGDTLSHSVSFTHNEPGTVQLRCIVRGTVLGRERSYEETLSLRFRPEETVADLLIDGSHSNAGLDALEQLKALAGESGLETSVFTGPLPPGGEFLLITPMQDQPEDSFLEDVGWFLEQGGSLLLVDRAGDNSPGNALLEALGATLRFGSEAVAEGVSTGFNADDSWCEALSPNQFFRHGPGFAVEAGSGQWLVKDSSGDHVLLAWEQVGGGTVFAAGCPVLNDAQLPPHQSLWQLPSANETIFQTLLGAAKPVLEPQTIGDIRKLPEGTLCRVKGYVTAGTSDPDTTFPDTLYLQDDTGGIAVTGFQVPGIQTGSPLEIIGVLQTEHGGPVLKYTDHRIPQESYYYYTPETIGCKVATDYALRGGQVVQVEGTVTALTKTPDSKGIARLTVKDIRGDSAVIEIGDSILSGSTGKNTLAKTVKKDRTVQVIGLLHKNEAGETVIRVRDCDEVVYLPPKADPTNPKTGDRRWWFR